MFGALYAADSHSRDALIDVARAFSPRMAIDGAGADVRAVTLDVSGLARLFGDARSLAEELRRTAADRGLRVRVAMAATRTAARLLAHGRPGITVVPDGEEAAAVGVLPLDLLTVVMDDGLAPPETRNPKPETRHLKPETRNLKPDPRIATLKRWGLRTLGDFARLPGPEVAARLGHSGVTWQRLARGEDLAPLVPHVDEERFEQALDLEWPIEGLEPLSFVLARLMEPLSLHLERRDRGAAVLHVRLHLVTHEVYERALQLPTPIRDAKTLRTLALLDLDSHPPPAAIDRVVVAVDPTPGRVLQFSLLARPLPAPEQISTLLARLAALMGEGRCGSPEVVDAWRPGAFAMKAFAPQDSEHGTQRHRDTEKKTLSSGFAPEVLCGSVPLCVVSLKTEARTPTLALRRFRFPIPARVRVESGAPVRVTTDRRELSGGRVDVCGGPWRTSGAWWVEKAGRDKAVKEKAEQDESWDRDEWEVTLADGATYRIFRERSSNAWFVEGVVD